MCLQWMRIHSYTILGQLLTSLLHYKFEHCYLQSSAQGLEKEEEYLHLYHYSFAFMKINTYSFFISLISLKWYLNFVKLSMYFLKYFLWSFSHSLMQYFNCQVDYLMNILLSKFCISRLKMYHHFNIHIQIDINFKDQTSLYFFCFEYLKFWIDFRLLHQKYYLFFFQEILKISCINFHHKYFKLYWQNILNLQI